MGWWLESITDWQAGAEAIRRRRYGVIDCRQGRFWAIHLRPLPKLVSAWEVWTLGQWSHRLRPGDRCLLYYNQPRRFPNFLVLKYLVSFRDTSIATVRRGLAVLDEVARLKQSDARIVQCGQLADFGSGDAPLRLGAGTAAGADLDTSSSGFTASGLATPQRPC